MKIKEGFMLREIVDTWVVVPLGERVVEFNGIMTLSETGALLWKEIEKGKDIDSLVVSITSEYEIDEETALKDTLEFVSKIESHGLLVQ
ncbi:PqqD family protein [Clostridium manihotivorum]|uniref:PqqD family protein n=1 Tax=Clostridium manihotivorum TaxID=2320868 RepID=A0A3R5VBE6_9CLOT|nr:PqqD family protein [Clostridium manihotivorum]QAA34510.1 PqqD family protein [Clostridium manihotivorum]